jgi:tRNA(Arg) A34 adenosine deaminase TadA
MNRLEMLAHLRTADNVAREAVRHGHHPFGAVLIGSDNQVLMRQGNIDVVRHAESELCRRAAATYPADFLWSTTLVTTVEPCAMCAGALYWANIGALVYGLEETRLIALTGTDQANPTMHLSCRTVLGSGQKSVAIHGPFAELEDELAAPHRQFWKR